PTARLPGPWYAGLGPFDFIYRMVSGQNFEILHRRHLKYGPVMRVGPRDVSISDCQVVKDLLSNHNYAKPVQVYKNVFEPLEPTILSTSDPIFHRKRKGILAPVFTWASLHRMEGTIRDSGVGPLIKKLRQICHQKQAHGINLYKEFVGMAFDVMGYLVFGQTFGAVEQDDITIVEWLGDYFVSATMIRALPILKGRLGNLIPPVRRGKMAMDSMCQLAIDAITRRQVLLATANCDGDFDTVPNDILQLMIGATDPNSGEKLSNIDLASESLLQLIAGSDTTGYALTWVMYGLLTHPECYRRLEAEVLDAFPLIPSQDVNPDSEVDLISHDDVKNRLPYLEAVIQEALRFYPPAVTSVPRIIPPEGLTIGSYFIPGGYLLSAPMYAINHSPLAFDRADEFIPERWLEVADMNTLKQSTLTFLSGPRTCLGRNLAMMELRLVMANLIRHFHCELSNRNVIPFEYVTLRPKNRELMVKLTAR
ncbi:cytochrome P450, partial [Dimargaris cristalligena]